MVSGKSQSIALLVVTLSMLTGLSLAASVAEQMPSNVWVNIDPGGGGAFQASGGGPTGIILVGSDLSGGYISYDKGASWECIGILRGMEGTHVSGVGFDPVDENIMYIGTGGGDWPGQVKGRVEGLYRSKDKGKTFETIVKGGYWEGMAFYPKNPNIGFVCRMPNWGDAKGQIYKTTDRGLTWQQVSKDLPDGLCLQRVYIHPTDEKTVYTVSTKKNKAKRAAFRSVNGGENWTQLGAEMGDINDLAIDPSNKQILYLGNSGGVYKSSDAGATWKKVTDAPAGRIFVNFKKPSVVKAISAKGVWESVDTGETWKQKSKMEDWNPGWTPSNKFSWWEQFGSVVCDDLSDPNRYYWVTDQFVYGSFDGGKMFKALHTKEISPGCWRTTGINNTEVYDVAISEANPDDVYIGFWDMGLWRSNTGGQCWMNSNNIALSGAWRGRGGNTRTIIADPARKGVVWAGIQGFGIAKSTAGGTAESWVAKEPRGTAWGLSLDKNSPVDKRILFAAIDNSIYRSTDDGETWKAVCSPRTGNVTRATAIDKFDSKIVYAGGEGGLWMSLGGGDVNTWTEIGTPEMKDVYSIRVDPLRKGWVYVTCYGDKRGLYRSKDKGKSWDKLLDDPYMRGVAIDPVDPNIIYATSSANYCCGATPFGSTGVNRSKDGGKTWKQVNEGLPWLYAWPIEINPKNPSQVYIGSPGIGFCKRIFSDRIAQSKKTN